MITIIHGNDLAKSRQAFTDYKLKYPEASITDGQSITLTQASQILEGGELFSVQKVLFIENFITRRKISSDFDDLNNFFQTHAGTNEIFFWEGREIDAKSLAKYHNAIIRLYKLPEALFYFLDCIRPGNTKQILTLFHQLLTVQDEEAVFYMLIRQIRILIALNQDKIGRIDEIKRMKEWQIAKLKKQSKLFNPSELTDIYNYLFNLELSYKTGKLPVSLTSSIDILLCAV